MISMPLWPHGSPTEAAAADITVDEVELTKFEWAWMKYNLEVEPARVAYRDSLRAINRHLSLDEQAERRAMARAEFVSVVRVASDAYCEATGP